MTKEIMKEGMSINNGWNKHQLAAIGEKQTRGWYQRIIGKEVTEEEVRGFLDYKDFHFSGKPEKIKNILLRKGKNNKPVFTDVTRNISFSDQYLHPNWQKMRLYILQRDGFCCVDCGSKDKQLHAHHLKYIYGKFIWDVPPFYIVTLCEDCHSKEHNRDLRAKKNI